MTGWPALPVIYEVNTAVWLQELSVAAGRPRTLSDVTPASGSPLPRTESMRSG